MSISRELQLARQKSLHRCVPFVHAVMWISWNRWSSVFFRREITALVGGPGNIAVYRHILVIPPNRYRRKTKNRLTPKHYRRIALPTKKYRHISVCRFRQSRYRRKMKNRLTPKNYRRMAISPRLCPPNKTLPTTTLNIFTCDIFNVHSFNCPKVELMHFPRTSSYKYQRTS